MKIANHWPAVALSIALVAFLQACGAGHSQALPVVPVPSSIMQTYPQSISPGMIAAPPMAGLDAASRPAMSLRKPQSNIQGLAFTQLPGAAVLVAASPDGTFWVLSTQGLPSGDKFIYHYVGGTYVNVPGAATRLAVGPDNVVWAVNSAGGIYHLQNGSFNPIAGGASEISIAADGAVLVISNQGAPGPYGHAIYRYLNGIWTQLPGAGVNITASADSGTYTFGNIAPGGFYVTNALGGIFYYNPSSGFTQLTGGAVAVAPTTSGGLFVLGDPANPFQHTIYYNNLSTGVWTAETGAAVSISTYGSYLYAIGGAGGIYVSPVSAPSPTPILGGGTPLSGPTYGPSSIGRSWGPTGVANALKFPVQSGYNGSGTTIAVVIDSNIYASDLAGYLSYFQVTQTNSVAVRLLGGASSTPASDVLEATLDVETIAGLAPGAKIVLYVMPSLTTSNFNNALAQIQQDAQASIISYSAGGCESTGTSPATSSIIATLASSIAVVAASGDQGSACFTHYNSSGQPLYLTGVNYPASDPNVIGVGGTESGDQSGATTLTSTVAWNDTFAVTGQEASGGGISTLFALPSYQVGVSGTASTRFRNVPDIAMPAVFAALYVNSQWELVNGTSWGTPQFAAMLSEIYQYCNRTSFSSAVSLPYTAFSRAQYSGFIDVLTGNNAFSLTSGFTPAYSAQVGFDDVTGIGVPLGMPLATALCPNRVPTVTTRAASLAVATQSVRTNAYSVDITPKAIGLTDLGRRGTNENTPVQLVISSSGSVESNEQGALAALRTAGFTIVQTFSNHLVVDATAPSGTVENFFSADMHNVAQPGSGTAFMPVTPIVVPAVLAPYVAGVVLDNVVTFSSRRR